MHFFGSTGTMLCSIDCMHCGWSMCHNAGRSQFTQGDKKMATIILKAVMLMLYDLYICHAFFGSTGTNDINVLD